MDGRFLLYNSTLDTFHRVTSSRNRSVTKPAASNLSFPVVQHQPGRVRGKGGHVTPIWRAAWAEKIFRAWQIRHLRSFQVNDMNVRAGHGSVFQPGHAREHDGITVGGPGGITLIAVSRRRFLRRPPSAGTTKIFQGLPGREAIKAIRVPSGDQRGM